MITSSPIGVAAASRPGLSGSGGGEAGGSGAAELVGRELGSYEELQAANELYARVFGYRDPSFALNPNLLVALRDNGGSVVGVFTPEGGIVGFAYGFAGRDAAGNDFHYSQSAVVDPAFQGRGIGRELKLLQRGVAERWGHRTMRWAFDPILTRNGHFNFSTLGAIGTAYLPDYYGRPCTDRLVVEWTLGDGADGERPDPYRAHRALAAPPLGGARWAAALPQADGAVWVPLPAEPATSVSAGLRGPLADTLQSLLAEGRVLVDCRRVDATTVAYLAVPRIGSVADASTAALPQEES